MTRQRDGLMKVGSFQFRGRAPSRKYACPECRTVFAAVNKNGGKECPNGHWYSIHYLNYFEKHGCLPAPRVKKEKPAPAEKRPRGVRRGFRDLGIMRHGDQCEIVLQWWVQCYEALLAQLPASTSKLLVTGALDQAYTLSKQLVR